MPLEDGSSEGLHQKQSTCGLSIRTATGRCGLQHLHGVLPFVEGGDGVDVQIHAQSVTELIGDQLRIDTVYGTALEMNFRRCWYRGALRALSDTKGVF